MFTVIIISNNDSAAAMERTLRSIRIQLYPASEVMVVERDATVPGHRWNDAYEPLKGQSLRCLTVPDACPAQARNRACQTATGQFITILDAGDELLSQTLEHYDRCFRQSPWVSVCYGRSVRRCVDGTFLEVSERTQQSGDVLEALLRDQLRIESSACAFRRDSLPRDVFRAHRFGLESLDLMIRLAESNSFRSANANVTIVARKPDTLTPAITTARCELLAEHAQRLLSRCSSDAIAESLATCEVDAALQWWAVGNLKQARRHLQNALSHTPRNLRVRTLRIWLRIHSSILDKSDTPRKRSA